MRMLERQRADRFAAMPICDSEPRSAPLPALTITRLPSARKHVRGSRPVEKKVVVADRNAPGSGAEGVSKYREAIIESLEDRLITEDEMETLTEIADRFRLSASQAHEVHVNYFQWVAEMVLVSAGVHRAS